MKRKDGKGSSRDSGFYDHMTPEELEAFNQALENVYGQDATYNRENGKVTYIDANGNVQKEELSVRQSQVKI
jgi:hypothetical protein